MYYAADILRSETIDRIKLNKAAGIDGVPGEFWKCLGENSLKELTDICQAIYRTGVWPDDFTKTVVIPLPKKANAIKCTDYRTISLIPHASKNNVEYTKAETRRKSRGVLIRFTVWLQKRDWRKRCYWINGNANSAQPGT